MTRHPMPVPVIHVGMKIQPFALSAWERRKILRGTISEHVRILKSLRRDGYAKPTAGDSAILTNHAKSAIRAFIHVIDNAHTVEVAGVHAGGHHLHQHPVNECYVDGGSGWSGMDFHAQLLWRATVDGNELVVLQPTATLRHCFPAHQIARLEIKDMASARQRMSNMTTTYGLRNTKTGRIIRLHEQCRAGRDPVYALSENRDLPYWKVDRFADLLMTFLENRPEEVTTASTPMWEADPKEYQMIRFRTDDEYDVDGGDPVCHIERIEAFNIGDVYDLRPAICHTRSIDLTHYGILQTIFPRYDMDRHEKMSLALAAHSGHGMLSLLGDIGVTHDRGPARIIGTADLPEDWPITEEQLAHKPFPDTRWALLLLDTSELESWLEFDQIATDTNLTKRVA